VFNAFDLKTIS